MPPSAFLLRKQKKQRHWEVWDYGLAEAVNMIDNEKCRKCGTEMWLAFSEDRDIQFEVEDHACHACAHLEEVQDKRSDKDAKKYGVTEFVKAVHADSELKDIKPEDVPKLDWKYREKYLLGE